jgi:hypothetical protein
MSFVDKFTTAMRHARPDPVEFPHDRFEGVLTDLVTALESMGVLAKLHPSVGSQRRTLSVAPANQPGRAQPLFAFVFGSDGVTIPGLYNTPLTEPEQLADVVAEILARPEFVETIEILRREAEAPIDARLRTSVDLKYTDADLLVEVSAEDQKRISSTTRGGRVQLRVKLSPFPGNGPFNPKQGYLVLDSAGILLNVEGITQEGGELEIRAVRG